LGHVECDEDDDCWFSVKYQIIPDGDGLSHVMDSQAFRYVTDSKSAVARKRYLLCPVCDKQRQSLLFARSWACAECHKLLRRSQVIPSGVADVEREAALRLLVGRGRPLGMHSGTYDRRRKELADLTKKLTNRSFSVAAAAHDRLVHEEWRSMDEDAEWQSGLSENWWLRSGR
jgi:protein-arginine kinase activator protein McsA